MKSLQKTAFVIIILALSLMGCGEAGSVGIFVSDDEDIQGKAASAAESLFLVPVHREYHESSAFAKTEDHLSVFVVYSSGVTRKVPLDEIEIILEKTILADDTPYSFKSAGEKQVVVNYGNLTAQYAIIVRSSTETPDGLSPSTPSGGTSVGIDIKWK
ncbi:MAG: hypothetical protein LBP81_05970 [Treponema sp.]|nr:hypothetical protein [Treponema sp.]